MTVEITSPIEGELRDIGAEYAYARERWGESFDTHNTINDYVAYATGYMGDAVKIENQNDPEAQRRMLLKAANLLITAANDIETGQITPRFYDAGGVAPPENYAHGEGRAFG